MRLKLHRHLQLKFNGSTVIGLLLSLAMSGVLYMGLFYQNKANAKAYPVQGFDVSNHQGEIDWQRIDPKKYQFVYLKATEGGDFVDKRFAENWQKARQQGFNVGAYHFYRMCRDGAVQAQNFIRTVPKVPRSLPPVIDLEYDGNCIKQFTQQQLLREIQIMHEQLAAHYKQAPLFYVSKAFYNVVLMGHFADTALWLRDYEAHANKQKPELKDGRDWLFWQYSQTGRIDGIATAVDLNVYAGSQHDWQQFLDTQTARDNQIETDDASPLLLPLSSTSPSPTLIDAPQ